MGIEFGRERDAGDYEKQDALESHPGTPTVERRTPVRRDTSLADKQRAELEFGAPPSGHLLPHWGRRMG